MAAPDAPPRQWMRANAVRYFAYFRRRTRSTALAIWRQSFRLGVGTLVFVAIIAATMTALDASAITAARRAPEWLILSFDYVTDFGKSFWFLVPIALTLAALALLASPTLPRMSQRLLAAIAVRLGFLLLAIGLPGLFFSVAKRLVGRARPLVGEAPVHSVTVRWAGASNMQACRRAIRSTHSRRPRRSARCGPGPGLSCGLTPLPLP